MIPAPDAPSFAILDGALCRVSRRGSVAKRHRPMGSRVAEFIAWKGILLVRESEEGFLTGMPNLYCMDEELKMLWLAELPSPEDAYAGELKIESETLLCRSRLGRDCRLDLDTGHLL